MELCKTDKSYKAKLVNSSTSNSVVGSVKLNLANIKNEFDVISDAGIAVVIEFQGIQIVVHEFGDIIFKSVADKNIIDGLAKKIYYLGCKGK